MDLVINNKIIQEPIENIIQELKRAAGWNVFKEIQNKGDYLRVTCPFHSDGNESHPSCSIFISYDSPTVAPGTYHCFTCQSKGTLYQLVAHVLNITEEQGKEWLLTRYGDLFYTNDLSIATIEEPKQIKKPEYLDESILDQYRYYHPYIEGRKVSFDIAKRFLVGYNKVRNTITFPVWDEFNNLVMITERAIDTKRFYIPANVEKPLYLLNFILDDISKGIRYPYIIVAEGQIDALTAWSYGVPCVATCGSLSEHQIQVLKNSNIPAFITMFDNDAAGQQFTYNFNKGIGKDKLVINAKINIPGRKDINDLSKEEFYSVLNNNQMLV